MATPDSAPGGNHAPERQATYGPGPRTGGSKPLRLLFLLGAAIFVAFWFWALFLIDKTAVNKIEDRAWAARAEAICEPDFATAAAALLFRRHDVGMRRPRLFELRRMLDVTWEDPVLISQQELPDTGLTKHTQLDASWRGDLLVPWRVIQRGRARALVEMDLGGDDGSLGGEGDVALHRALCALDPTGEVLGGTPLAAGGGVKTGGVVLFITS